MPITVRCSCGKLLQARDDWAGRQAKCPQCGSALTIPGGQAAPAPAPSEFTDLLDEELARPTPPSGATAAAAPARKPLRIDDRCTVNVPPEREVVAAIENGVRNHIEQFGEGGFRDVDIQIEIVEWKWGSMHTSVVLSLTGWVNGNRVKKRSWAGHASLHMYGLLGLLIAAVEKSLRSGRRLSRAQRRYLDKCLLDLYVALDRASGRPRPKGTRLWTAITAVGATISLAAMVLTIFALGNLGRCLSAAVFGGVIVGGLLLIVTLLVRALAMPADFYERDARGRAALARSKVKTAFGLKALLVFGVVLCVGVVILVIALVSRPLQPRGPRPQTAEAEPAGPQDNEGPDDRYTAWEEALRERDERLREERESAAQDTPESTSPPAGEPAQEASPESEADPRAFPGMPFSPFGARGSNASDRTYDPPPTPAFHSPGEPGRRFGPPMGGAGAASGDPDLAGGPGGGAFRTASPDGQPVIGFQYSLGSWAGQKAIRRLEPLFRPESPDGREEILLARDGYAVGTLHVDAGQFVRAVRVVFMRITSNGRLDPDDAYTSDWLGSPAGNDPKTLGGTGKKVIGIRGRRAAVLDAVGLVIEDS